LEINKYHSLIFQLVKSSMPIIFTLLSITSFNVSSAFNSDKEKNQLNKTKIEYYQKDNITNQVPYFDNRFRIDANIEEITLIFYRKSGSTPIILIRPDGSKIRVNEFDRAKVEWFDDSTFDMIKIKTPMPGPWQAVGDILPNSQILVVSDVKIAVEPLPNIAFSGETLKVEGKLFNGNDNINSPHFQKVVKLDVNFYSTNNSSYENFGADAIKVTTFRDDGRGLDEYASDNVFTGEFVLDFAAGEWQPVYLVKLPMSTRELRQTAILLHKTPISIHVVQSEEKDKPHQINFVIDPTYVDVNSLVFQGKFTFPDRQIEPFSIMEEMGDSRTKTITNTEPGIYRVNVSAFGKTITGREFRLVVPEYTFNVESSNEMVMGADGIPINDSATFIGTTDILLAEAEAAKKEALLLQQQILEEKEEETLLLIILGNSLIIVVSVVLFFTLRRRKPKKNE
jgi:uncharacterized protein (TIGR03503 family)